MERCFHLRIETWRKRWFNSTRAAILSFLILVIFLLVNIEQVFHEHFITENLTSVNNAACNYDEIEIKWAPVIKFFSFFNYF